MQIRLLDFMRTGQCFETWLFTDPRDYRSGTRCTAHPTMERADALAYWNARGFKATRRTASEYHLSLVES